MLAHGIASNVVKVWFVMLSKTEKRSYCVILVLFVLFCHVGNVSVPFETRIWFILPVPILTIQPDELIRTPFEWFSNDFEYISPFLLK